MKLVLGVLLILAGSGAALRFGFGALLLGGGSSSQAAEAPLQLAGAVVGVIVAIAGVFQVKGEPTEPVQRKPPEA